MADPVHEQAGTTPAEPIICTGCKHDIPGGCMKSYWGEDGWLHFPEGNCKETDDGDQT